MFMNYLLKLIADYYRLFFVRELKRSESLGKTFTSDKKFNALKYSTNMEDSNFTET